MTGILQDAFDQGEASGGHSATNAGVAPMLIDNQGVDLTRSVCKSVNPSVAPFPGAFGMCVYCRCT